MSKKQRSHSIYLSYYMKWVTTSRTYSNCYYIYITSGSNQNQGILILILWQDTESNQNMHNITNPINIHVQKAILLLHVQEVWTLFIQIIYRFKIDLIQNMHNITNHYSIHTQKGILLLNNFSIVIVTFQVETTRGEYLSINKQTFHQR